MPARRAPDQIGSKSWWNTTRCAAIRNALAQRLIDGPLSAGRLRHRAQQDDAARGRDLLEHIERRVHRFQRRLEIVAQYRHAVGKHHRIHAPARRRKVTQSGQHAVQRVTFEMRDRDRGEDRIDHMAAKQAYGYLALFAESLQAKARSARPVQSDFVSPNVARGAEAERDDPRASLLPHPHDIGIVAVQNGDAGRRQRLNHP
jgi:hypothetical protein